ncbi:hypothetical protein B0H13DRAFT_1881973 [Mycena leptocephala]|nr:hypothetical protein B0H13DRAFT_1881973 [Mycena leptocephala]
MLPWGWGKPPGLSDSEPVCKLWRFLGPHWLAGSQQNDMLELLRHKVDTDPVLVEKIRIQGVDLVPKILEAHKSGSDTYKTSQGFRWIRDVAEDLIRNQTALVTSAHLGQINNEPHWIALVFDFSQPTAKLLYGDSFGELMRRRSWLHVAGGSASIRGLTWSWRTSPWALRATVSHAECWWTTASSISLTRTFS